MKTIAELEREKQRLLNIRESHEEMEKMNEKRNRLSHEISALKHPKRAMIFNKLREAGSKLREEGQHKKQTNNNFFAGALPKKQNINYVGNITSGFSGTKKPKKNIYTLPKLRF